MTHHAAARTIPTNALSIKILEILLILIQNQATEKNGFYALFKKVGWWKNDSYAAARTLPTNALSIKILKIL